jgi:hypothetical protein
MRVLLFLPLTFAFACLALLSLLAFLGVIIIARALQVIATTRSVIGRPLISEQAGRPSDT